MTHKTYSATGSNTNCSQTPLYSCVWTSWKVSTCVKITFSQPLTSSLSPSSIDGSLVPTRSLVRVLSHPYLLLLKLTTVLFVGKIVHTFHYLQCNDHEEVPVNQDWVLSFGQDEPGTSFPCFFNILYFLKGISKFCDIFTTYMHLGSTFTVPYVSGVTFL